MRTQVGIVGAGPAGLLLSHLLHLEGIESVVLESQSREHVESRVRAGVLEQGTVDLLITSGVGDRLRREGLTHHGIELSFGGKRHRIALTELTGRSITVYAQQEVIKDLIAARLAAGGEILFEAAVREVDSGAATVRFVESGEPRELQCDFIAGCDGFHGVCRASIPREAIATYERGYAFAWLGVLAEAAPSSRELVYTYHDRGFALFSMRSPSITRLYLQCAPGEQADAWSDDRVWEEIGLRMTTGDGWKPAVGRILHKSVTGMRSFVCEPMQHERLFLAGDAAHIVPPTGAKGLNLAVSDVSVLAKALSAFYSSGRRELLERYSETCLKRVWQAQRFSSWMTGLLHRAPGDDGFEHRRRLAELGYIVGSRAASTALAENYVGLPLGR